jgi:hypothetical protein
VVGNIRMDLLELRWFDVDWACSTIGGEKECVLVVCGKAIGKEATRKTKT